MADGTAQQCGRVGSCHIYLKSLSGNREAFFYYKYLVFKNDIDLTGESKNYLLFVSVIIYSYYN
jgi:hypothetical protein